MRRLPLVPAAALLIGTALYHRYSLLSGLDLVQADNGDSRFIAFLLEHWNNTLHGAADWRSPPIFWPVRGTLAYSDALLAMGLLHAGLRTALPVFAAINVQLVLLTAATFLASYALLSRGLRLGVWGATVGAWFFAFSWPRFAQLVHLQLQFTPLLPLIALAALQCLRDGDQMPRVGFAGRAAAIAAMLAVLLATTPYYAVFMALALCVAVLLAALARPARQRLGAVLARQWPGLAAALLLGALLALPILLFYRGVAHQSGGRAWTELSGLLPHATDFLWMGRENLAWGWVFRRFSAAAHYAHWPELRIGVGAVATAVWIVGIAWALWTARRPGPARLVALAVLTGAGLQALMLQTAGGHSLWWGVWRWFPGAAGLRSIARLELLVTLAMAVWFGWLVDRAAGRGPAVRLLAAVLCVAGAAEQLGSVETYSGRVYEALSRSVGQRLHGDCAASYVEAPPDLAPPPAPVDAAHFDAQAYLAANPDVARSWHDTPWSHYVQFGRAEGRSLDPAAADRRVKLILFAYNYTIPLAAAMARRPVVNGLSGWQPPGWQLFDVLSPAIAAQLGAWLQQNRVAADAVCTVAIRITLDDVPQTPPQFWP